MAATASESISAVHVVQALSLHDKFDSEFSAQNKKSLKDGVKTRRLAAKLERTVDILVAIATAIVLWYGGFLTLRGELTAGELVLFLTYLKRGMRPLQDFAKYTGRLAKATAAGERVVEILDRTPEVRDLPNATRRAGLFRRYHFRRRVIFLWRQKNGPRPCVTYHTS